MKSLLASARVDGGDAKQAQQAQLAALRVQAAMLLPASAEHSKTLPFTKGEQRTCDMPPQACVHHCGCLHAYVCSICRAGLLQWCAPYGGLRASHIPSYSYAGDLRWE